MDDDRALPLSDQEYRGFLVGLIAAVVWLLIPWLLVCTGPLLVQSSAGILAFGLLGGAAALTAVTGSAWATVRTIPAGVRGVRDGEPRRFSRSILLIFLGLTHVGGLLVLVALVALVGWLAL